MRFRLTFIFLLCWLSSFAHHIVGGEIYYDYLGNNQYRISITIYRDVLAGVAYDDPLSLGIYNSSGQLISNVLIPLTSVPIPIPIVFNNPCVSPPTDILIDEVTYVTIITLPPITGGYSLSYQRCCLGDEVTNLLDPENTGLTLVANIPGVETNFQSNNSPRFNKYPPLVLCNSETLLFDHSGNDPDGDVLVYSLITPISGANSTSPQPNPPPAPPYIPVTWLGGYTSSNPLGSGSSISINSNTGLLTVDPNLVGKYAIAILAQEYRNGILIGQTIRDFLFWVIDCNKTLIADIPSQENMSYFISYCQGLTVSFDNNSFGATSYAWDFGVPNISTDISTQYQPNYTYPAQGSYQVRLIANPGWPCTDTIIQTIVVNELLEVSYTTSPDSVCIIGNDFDFDGTAIGTTNATYTWAFGPDASILSSTNLDVNNVIFNTSGFIPVTLIGHIGTCNDVYKDSIYIFPKPTVDFHPPPNYLCDGLTTSLLNSTLDATKFKWDFGVSSILSDTSNQFQPTYTFPDSGSYQVKLIASSEGACIDSSFHTLVMNEVLDIWFTNNDSLCITGNSFNFDGTKIGSPLTNYTWNFGNNAYPNTSTDLDVNNVSFNVTGNISITLTANYENCTDSQTSSVFIYKEPTNDFSIESGLQCVPFTAKFINLCTSDSPLNYSWNFGDGGISSNKNPIYIYDSVGYFDVILEIYANKGCVDTVSLTKEDFIKIRPSPTSNFTLTPTFTDICHSKVQFKDESIGGNYYYYNFNGEAFSDEKDPEYYYTKDGIYNPYQIVINEYLCTDTSRQEIYIEPFMVYIPNAFTPDGDNFNNEFNVVSSMNALEWDFNIYDRWGNEIFHSTDSKVGWDGKLKGLKVQTGLYTYKLRYISCEETRAIHELTGHFSLLK